MTYLQLLGSSMPDDWNPTTWREMYLWFVEKTRAILQEDLALFNFGSTRPTVENEGKPWIKTDASGRLIGTYTHAAGNWVRPHPIPAGSDYRMLWVGSLADLIIFERAGENPADVGGLYSGPFWEEDTAWRGRIPCGVGDIPDDTHSLAVEEDYGSGTHVLTNAELPASIGPLSVTLTGFKVNLESGPPQWLASLASTGAAITTPSTEVATMQFTNAAGGTAFSTIPPVRGVYVCKRSQREYFIG